MNIFDYKCENCGHATVFHYGENIKVISKLPLGFELVKRLAIRIPCVERDRHGLQCKCNNLKVKDNTCVSCGKEIPKSFIPYCEDCFIKLDKQWRKAIKKRGGK